MPRRRPSTNAMFSLIGLAVFAAGCTGTDTSAPTQSGGAKTPSATAEAPKSEREEALSQLSAADRSLVESQQVCVVSKEALGSMGVPIKVSVEGRDVFVCCESCRKPLEADPAKYLAELDEAAAQAAKAAETTTGVAPTPPAATEAPAATETPAATTEAPAATN